MGSKTNAKDKNRRKRPLNTSYLRYNQTSDILPFLHPPRVRDTVRTNAVGAETTLTRTKKKVYQLSLGLNIANIFLPKGKCNVDMC